MSFLKYIPVICCWLAVAGCSKKGATGQLPPVTPPVTTGRVIHVSTTAELKTALQNALPADEIIMADGVYKGKFVVAPTVDGTAAKPIVLRGSRNAVLDAESVNTGYVLYLQADHWIIKGFTIMNGLKGIMADGVHYTVIDSVKVYNIGEEAIHLRKFSSHNTIRQTEISHTGLKTPDYGEGIYIGSAKSNWATYTSGNPDLCDSNNVFDNKIGPQVTAECIDIKEGTTG